MLYFKKGFRSFNAENLGSVGQRAAKLLAVKVGVLKKKSAALAFTVKDCSLISFILSYKIISGESPKLLQYGETTLYTTYRVDSHFKLEMGLK